MRSTRMLLVGVLLTLVAPLAGATRAAEDQMASASPGPTAGVFPLVTATPRPSGTELGPTLWLAGPFGRVPGTDPGHPAGAAPGNQALDAWVRRAPLRIDIEPQPTGPVRLSVTAHRLDDSSVVERLSDGVFAFEGPDETGRSVVVASLTTATSSSQHAWLLDVPDREPTGDTLFEMPGPEVLLVGADGEITGAHGHGCHVYLCVEGGRLPDHDLLEPLRIAVGETPSLRADDGSALVGWVGTLYPVGQTGAVPVEADATLPGPDATPTLAGLAPSTPGEYRLELRAEFDRERGWQWMAYRIIAE